MIRPGLLRRGDTVGIAAPSISRGVAVDSESPAWKRGLATLARLGFEVRLTPELWARRDEVDTSAATRARELNTLWSDESVRAIFCLSGGWGSQSVLPLLDWPTVRHNPKILVGYSDGTALLTGISCQAGLVTFHGPTIFDGLSEYPEPLADTARSLQQVTGQAVAPGRLVTPSHWTTDYPSQDRPRRLVPNPAWSWVQAGRGCGQLWGGNLSTLLGLVGTPFWPSLQDRILFLEDVALFANADLCVQRFIASLVHLQQLGVLDQVAGVILGKVADLPDERHRQLEQVLGRLVPDGTPILSRVDLGHTDPKLTIPIGVTATLDASRDWFSIDDPAVTAFPRQPTEPHVRRTNPAAAKTEIGQTGGNGDGMNAARLVVRRSTPRDVDAWLDLLTAVATEGRWIGTEVPIDREPGGPASCKA